MAQKITRENGIKAYNINKDLVTWNYDANSLSSNNFQKLKDAFKVSNIMKKFSILKSIFCLIKLFFSIHLKENFNILCTLT